ncbi:MAG: 30S ribosomal protein S4 [Candidatus Muiribacterium halophilum]|uniref:Small ribosomal subunit protein uS4 n=1 Tax=Muiribacterium halophilum TaxID=2053465 RepID=A0A2N5ZJD6_MUIH1|nr:MAG: 30S ribosomal protein S4 [Candidatus Muirbacterium halophilum]
MARNTGPVCRKCRAQGIKLFLKGDRCYSEKCALNKKNFRPGIHGKRRRKLSDYGLQLMEKQKVRNMYGVLEKQFRLYYEKAARTKGVTGEILLEFLERRLDNVIYRMGFLTSRAEARQWVLHGHIKVNGRKVNIPSFLVKPGDVIEIKEKSRQSSRLKQVLDAEEPRTTVDWVDVNHSERKGTFKEVPTRESLDQDINEQLIVEFYSR